jgi:hypothetical protein
MKDKKEERSKVLEKQARIEALRSKRYKSFKIMLRDPAVYIICEKKKILTGIRNKCNALYVGESTMMAKRASAYADLKHPNNELVAKLMNKLKKPREYIIEKLDGNFHVRCFKEFKTINNDLQRQEIEGYMINRLNPLLNTSKRKGYFKRSFIEKKESESDYWEEVEDTYKTELYVFGDTKTIYHVGKKDFVKRESVDGHEAMHIQCQRSFNTWVKENNIKNRKNEWKKDPEAFYASLTGLRDLWKYKKLKDDDRVTLPEKESI